MPSLDTLKQNLVAAQRAIETAGNEIEAARQTARTEMRQYGVALNRWLQDGGAEPDRAALDAAIANLKAVQDKYGVQASS